MDPIEDTKNRTDYFGALAKAIWPQPRPSSGNTGSKSAGNEASSPRASSPSPSASPANEAIASSPQSNVDRAQSDLKMTPQERNLYDHHTDELNNGGYWHGDDTLSTVFGTTVEQDGKTYMIPRIYQGHLVSPDEAVQIATMRGIDQYPSYASADEAKARYDAIHEYMDRDTEAHFNKLRQQSRDAQQGPAGLIDQ